MSAPASLTATQVDVRARIDSTTLWSTALLAIAFASIFAERLAPGGVAVARLLAPVALVAALVGWSRRGWEGLALAPLGVACAYASWAVASGLWTSSQSGTLELLGSLAVALAYTAAFAMLLTTRAELRAVLAVAALAAIVTGAAEVVGYAIGPGTRGGAGVGDPNFAAAYLLVALPLVLVVAAEERNARWRAAILGGAVLVALGVLATLSRGGLIALGVLFVAALFLPARALFRSRRSKRRLLLGVAVVVALAFALGGAGASRFETLYNNAGTGAGRLNEWRAAWSVIDARPLLGVGYGAFQAQSNELMRQTPGVDLATFSLRQNGSQAHSAYVGSAAELGIPGFALFVALLVVTGGTLLRTALLADRRGERLVMRTAFALLAGLAAWAAASIFLSTETSRPLWIILGLAVALPRLLRTSEHSP